MAEIKRIEEKIMVLKVAHGVLVAKIQSLEAQQSKLVEQEQGFEKGLNLINNDIKKTQNEIELKEREILLALNTSEKILREKFSQGKRQIV